MNYDDLLNRIEEEAAGAPASGPGSGVSSPGSEGATTEDNIAYLPSQKKVVRPVCRGKKKQCKDVKEDSNDLPEEQAQLLDIKGPAKGDDLFATSSFSGEENYVKLWLLNDGSFVWVDDAHLTVLQDADIDADYEEDEAFEIISDFIGSGAIRVSSYPGHEMDIDFSEEPTSLQIQSLIRLAGDHNSKEVIVGDGSGDTESAVVKLKSPKDLSRILRGQVKHQSLATQFHESLEEAMEEDMTKLREDLKPSLTRLFEGDPFHLVERDVMLWKSRFGVDRYLTAGAPLVSIEKKVRDLQKLAGTLLQKYGNDRGYLEMLIEAMAEREPLNSFDGFKSNDYLYGTRMHSSHEGIEMVFEAALDPLYNVSETIYVSDNDVLDRWSELVRGIKIVGNVVYPKGERFTPGLLQLLEHAIIDTIDAAYEVEAEEEME